MICMDAQKLIISFINDKLDDKELEEFLYHIKSCSSCSEELEIYFTLLAAMRQLDEDKNLSNNYRLELTKKINISEEKLINKKIAHIRKVGVFFAIVITLSIIISFKDGVISKEKTRFHVETVSDFDLKYHFKSQRYKNQEAEYFIYLQTIYNIEANVPE